MAARRIESADKSIIDHFERNLMLQNKLTRRGSYVSEMPITCACV
jgi:hypothetical protein